MKKWISILLIVTLLICCLSACGEKDPKTGGGKTEQTEFPEIVVSEGNLVNLIGKPLADAKKVFGKDYYAAQEVSYKGEKQTGYTYSFGDQVYATVFVRDVKGEKIIYRISIDGHNADKVIKDSNVTIFGNIMLEDITPEIAEHYKDKFYGESSSKFYMTTVKSGDKVNDLGIISSSVGEAQIEWLGSSEDGKVSSFQITNEKIENVKKDEPVPQKLPIQYSDSADRSAYPALATLLNKTEKEIQAIFGKPSDVPSTYMFNGEGQYDYKGKDSYLIFGFLEGKTESILFSSKNKNDAMPIIGSVKFSDNYKTISQKVPKGYTLREQYKEGKETTYCLEGTGARVQLTWNDAYGRSNYSTDALTTVYID